MKKCCSYPMIWRRTAEETVRQRSPPLTSLSVWSDGEQRLWEGPKVSEGVTEGQGMGGPVMRERGLVLVVVVANMLHCCMSICLPVPPPPLISLPSPFGSLSTLSSRLPHQLLPSHCSLFLSTVIAWAMTNMDFSMEQAKKRITFHLVFASF